MQQVFMPDGHKIFESSDERVFYSADIAAKMWDAGYEVYLDGKPWPDSKRKGRWAKEAKAAL